MQFIKNDGEIRVHADYKITVIKRIVDIEHPHLRMGELFRAVEGGGYLRNWILRMVTIYLK